jgi:HAE1 family hydrophobic/amphiphilic exporter-1
MAIPLSVIATFNLMFFNKITFNIMSLGGLALGVGMLVDNSIVVIENILRRRTFEPDARLSAERGAREVSGAITASTLTNIMVFFPILYLEGMFRQIFGDLAWTVAFSLICSEIVALSLVPMLTVVLGKRVRLPREVFDEMDLPPEARGKLDELLKDDETDPDRETRPRTGSLIWYKNYRAFRESEAAALGRTPGKYFKVWTFISFWLYRPYFLAAYVLKRIGGGTSGVFGLVMKVPLALFDLGFGQLKKSYPEFLRSLLKRPVLVVLFAIGLSLASAGLLYLMGWELMPSVDQGEFRVHVELPTGTPIEETNRRLIRMEKEVRKIPSRQDITTVFATVGIGTAEGEGASEKAENIGEVHVALLPRDFRDVPDEEIITETMSRLENEVSAVVRSAKPQLLSYKTPIEIELEGSNLQLLKQAADEVVGKISTIEGLLEIESSMAEANPEVNITIDRDRARSLGLSVSEITEVVRLKVKGDVPTRFDLADQQIDIVVELEENDRATYERLKRLTIPAPNGDVRLEQVAVIKPGLGPATITRVENSRVALITANIHGRPLGDVVKDLKAEMNSMVFSSGIFWKITGQNEEMQRSMPSLYLALGLAITLVYIVLAAQFESLIHPFVIMFCVPFSLVGLALILPLTGQTINIFSLIGVLMMLGISVNDAIVLITTVNQRRDEGLERIEAIVEAGRSRFRPILITSLTTILGMAPMAVALGPGAEMRVPMALTVIGGLTASTTFTLIAIPCVYLVLDNILPRSYRPHLAAGAEPGVEAPPPAAP